MKCKLIRKMFGANPNYDPQAALDAAAKGEKYDVPEDVWLDPGTEIEHPDCHLLVGAGVAVPLDDECRERSGNPSAAELAKRAKHYDKLARGQATGIKALDSSGS